MSDLFIRKATGLVRSWSVFDAFVYALFSINLVTLGFYSFSQMYYFQGGIIPALIIAALFIIFEVVVYSSLIAVMPRSGGDYVWQSRIFGSGVGFVLAITGWWFILWLWVPLYADMLRHIVITPILALVGLKDIAIWFGQSSIGLFVTSLITLSIVTFYIILGMKSYAKIQKICFYGGMLGLAIVVFMLLTGSPETFKAGLDSNLNSLYGIQGSVYDNIVKEGTDAGAALPLTGGSFGLIMLTLPYLVFFNLWPNWGATLYGEVRGATDFKRNFAGMAWALGVTTVLAIVVLFSISKSIGWDFYVQANGAYWNYAWGYTDVAPSMPFWPYPALLAVFMSSSRILQIIVILLMSMWWFGWSGTVFLSSTRVIFAAAFDRLLPEKVAEVDERTHTPIYALLMMVIPSIVISYLFAFDIFSFRSLTLDSTLVIAVTYLGTTLGAIVLPFKKPELYNASPIAKFKVFGFPLISLAGIIFGGFLTFLLVEWLFDPWLNGTPLYGISLQNTPSLIFMGFMYGTAFLLYFGFKAYRKSKGIDIDKINQEIPID
jgi:amino acid transporter